MLTGGCRPALLWRIFVFSPSPVQIPLCFKLGLSIQLRLWHCSPKLHFKNPLCFTFSNLLLENQHRTYTSTQLGTRMPFRYLEKQEMGCYAKASVYSKNQQFSFSLPLFEHNGRCWRCKLLPCLANICTSNPSQTSGDVL